jgi:ParB family chromosome partitioning protein
MGHARALLGLDDPRQQLQLYNQITSQELSVRQVEEAARTSKSVAPASKKVNLVLPDNLQSVLAQLNKRLDAKVDLKSDPKGKGQLNIKFNSAEQLESILKKLIPE